MTYETALKHADVTKPKILGIGGTPNANSGTEKALATALGAARESGAETTMIAGPDLVLPMYQYVQGDRGAKEMRVVNAMRACDGIIIASPSYHGSISGLMKNVLDYTEDLREDERVYFDGLAVGVIACAGGWQAAVQTISAMRSIAHALRGWPTPLAASLNTSANLFDTDGNCTDMAARFQLETVGRQVVEFAQLRQSSLAA
ncbi:NAD(P)H-dependent oxidoreductase [Sulfitobacter sp. F26204]|uniref:NADPH-dependent FMN reductase n=1 Tax=Sulfitobacter sp. F26204 TaxID=2996014 RepID=UPI00225E659A|nr:NAD(P)H-dependent oxidoreductase [Sulfitobacter sp. F26204]MCX7561455.1 NAD(P)H-dependent oxidoreductase [Sulfitobacter sp. F26204]